MKDDATGAAMNRGMSNDAVYAAMKNDHNGGVRAVFILPSSSFML